MNISHEYLMQHSLKLGGTIQLPFLMGKSTWYRPILKGLGTLRGIGGIAQ